MTAAIIEQQNTLNTIILLSASFAFSSSPAPRYCPTTLLMHAPSCINTILKRFVIVVAMFCCSIMAAVMLLVGGFFPQIYNTTDEIKSLATSFIAVSAIIMPFCAFTHSSYFTLRSGGKTLVTFLFDSVFTWVIVVPVAFVLAKYTALGIVAVYFLVQATELIKVVIGYFMVKSDVWLVQMV